MENLISYKRTENKCNTWAKRAERNFFKRLQKMELWQAKKWLYLK